MSEARIYTSEWVSLENEIYQAELIKRPKRYIEVSNLPNFEVNCSDGNKYVLLPFEHLYDIPAAEVAEVVHGMWIHQPPYTASNGEYLKASECSVCHTLYTSNGNTPYSDYPYCCRCGAKMDESYYEEVEVCPCCGGENVYPLWNTEEKGFVATCQHCGEEILLCDACQHTVCEDGEPHNCDWRETDCGGKCHRGETTKKECK